MNGNQIPERNWRKWWLGYLAHAATGAMSGAGVGLAITTGELSYALTFTLSFHVMVRQTVEFLRRHDTPGRDLGDHITGYVVGGGIAIISGSLYL